jgi:enoyl-CoA hydratase
MAMEYELARDGERAVAHLRIDDGKANALNDAFVDGLESTIERSRGDGAGALVVWGRDGCVSGGIDLAVLRGDDAEARAATLARVARGLLALWTAPVPTVAAVTGHAIAGGAVLAMACDRRIVVDDDAIRVGLNETALGMVLPTWATVIAQSAVRPDRVTDVMLLGRVMSARDAATTGIVERAVPPAAFGDAVADAAAEAATLPTAAYAGTKRRLRAAEAARADAEVEREMSGFAGPSRGR